MADEPVTAILNVPDVSCEHCVKSVNEAIGHLPSVQHVQVDLETKQVRFTYDPHDVTMHKIEQALDDAGYPVAPDIEKIDANATAEAGPQQ